ncbi:TonB-dependent receptor [Alteraurantiacibacter aestuarii]|uniref:TonB-dependent siderophore receptor n=1 Tax=Alteraurantiacibacter aestuarii TaxID=650004 RepID=A0A844ZMF8_9SPHN|nr:TonB-dependent siderophore receptor [Alteraurantiacibacter aestuarii]MXO88793.1 TonB-dependent siderophore receptor [Alteraurantiacibacter aestuarii]
MTHSTTLRSALLLSASSLFLAVPAQANEAAQRDYLPTHIVVTAQVDSYVGDDGSTATKTPTPLIDVPQTVTVITSDQIEDQGVTQLGNALRYVPGVSLESGEGHRDEVFIRGQETTADFYLDGLRDDAQYYRSLYNVDRIEVLKGANALIFGRGAGGGAVNRVSKMAETDMAFGSGAASIDSFGAFSVSGDVNTPVSSTAALRLNATYEDFANHRDFYNGRFIGVTPTLTIEPGADTRFIASYTYDNDERVTDRGIPSLNGLPLAGYDKTFFGDPDYNNSEVEVHIARARVEHDFSRAISVNASLQYADYDKFYANLVPSSGTTATTTRLAGYESATTRTNLIGQANLVGNFDTGSIAHTILVGAEFTSGDTDSVRNQARFNNGADTSITVPLADVIVPPAFTLVPQRATTSDLSTVSFYIQEQMDLGIVQLVAGVRYDEFDLSSTDLVANYAAARKDSRFSPRLGVIVKPQDNISLYASFSESFLPQSGDQFTVLDSVDVALKPETFENWEAGIKWSIHPELFLTAAIFRLTRDNTQAPDPAGSGLTVAAGESQVEGFEFGLAGELVDNLNVSLGYAYLDGEITETTSAAVAGTTLQQVAKHHITAWTRYDVTDRLGFGAGVIHQSRQFASMSNNVVLPAYTRVDAAIYFDVTDSLGLQVNIENLFDEEYYPSAHGDNNIQPAKPLTATLGARMKF